MYLILDNVMVKTDVWFAIRLKRIKMVETEVCIDWLAHLWIVLEYH